MLLNERLNDTTQKILWAESVQTCERVSNSMVKTGITKSPFEVFFGDKPNIIGSFSEFWMYFLRHEEVKC